MVTTNQQKEQQITIEKKDGTSSTFNIKSIQYIRNIDGTRIGVMGAYEKEGVLYFGYSVAAHGDVFDRVLGKHLAVARAESRHDARSFKHFITTKRVIHSKTRGAVEIESELPKAYQNMFLKFINKVSSRKGNDMYMLATWVADGIITYNRNSDGIEKSLKKNWLKFQRRATARKVVGMIAKSDRMLQELQQLILRHEQEQRPKILQ